MKVSIPVSSLRVLLAGFLSLFTIHTVHSQSATWDGNTSNVWGLSDNWNPDTVPGTGSNDIATFSGNTSDVNDNTTIDLGGTVTTGGIRFTSGNAASYTIGTAGDILNLFVLYDNTATDNDANIIVESSVTADQIIAADILLGDGTGTTGFRDENALINSSTNAELIVTGNIAAGTGGTVPGSVARLMLQGAGDITINGDINETPTATSASRIDMFVDNAGTKTFTGSLTGSTNNYLQTILRSGGIFTLASGSNLGTGRIEVRNGTLNVETATLQLDNGLLLGSTNQGTGNANINISSGSTLILNSNVDYQDRSDPTDFANQATISGGTIQLAGGDRTFDIDDNTLISGAEVTISSNVTNDGTDRALVKNDTGTLLLSGTNDYGDTRINNGLIIVSGGNALSDTNLLTVDSSGGEGDLQLNSSETVGNFDGTGNVNLQGNTLTFGDANNTTFSGLISGAGGSLVKNGAGTFSLTNAGAHTFTGDTTINNGLFELTGSLSSNVTVADGGNIGGEGSTSGNLIFAGTTHTLSADASTSASLGTTSELDVSAPTTITVNLSGSGVGNISVLDYGSLTGDTNNFVLGANNSSSRGGSIVDTGSAIAVNLGFVSNTWQGNDGSDPNFWDSGVTSNWTNDSDSVFINGDAAIFDDTASSFTPILQENITVDTITFNNNSNAYTISSNGSEVLTISNGIIANNTASATISSDVVGTDGLQISGSGDLTLSGTVGNGGSGGVTKTGTGSTTITGLIDDTGARTVTEGSLILTDGAFPTVARTYTTGDGTNGTLVFDGIISTSGVLGTVSGNGTWRKTGSGTATFFSGGTTINMGSEGLISIDGGTLSFGGNAPGVWTNNRADMFIASGAVFSGQNTPIVIDALNGGGRLLIGANGTDALTLGANGGSGTFSGSIENAGLGSNNNANLTKTGAGTQTLNGDNTYTGATTVSEGQLNIGGTNVSTITVAAGANLGGEGSTSGDIIFSGNTHSLDIDAGTSAALGGNLLDVTALNNSGFNINVSGTGSGNITVLNYGSNGFSGDVNAFSLGSNTTSGRGGAGTFVDNGVDAIVINLGFLTDTWVGGNATNPTFWDNGVTANWSNSSDSLFFNGDDVIFDETASDFTPTLQENVSVNNATFTSNGPAYTLSGNSGTETLTVTGALVVEDSGSVTLDVSLAGDGSISTSGDATLVLNKANTTTGNVMVSGNGTLALGVSDTLGDTSTLNQETGTSDVFLAGGVTETISSYQATNGRLGLGFTSAGVQGGDAELILTSDSTINNIEVGTNGTVTLGDNVTVSINSVSQLGGGDTFTINTGTGATANINGAINSGDGDGGFTKSGAGTARVSANNSAYGGDTIINNGILEFTTINNYNVSSSLGDGDAAGANTSVIKIGSDANSATLRMTTNSSSSTDRDFQVGDAGGTIDIADGSETLTISGNVTGDGATGNGALTKAGAGTLILSGTNSYSGGTNINAGTLQIGSGGATGTIGTGNVVNNSSLIFNRTGDYSVADVTGSGTIAVNAGNLTLSGTNYTNDITVGTGANLLGEAITSGSLTFNGPTHTIEADATTSNSLGTSALLDASGATITVNLTGTAAGNITVLDYGTINGGIGNFVLGANTSSSRGGSISDNGSAIVVSLGFVDNVWTGNTVNPTFWDVNSTQNWENSSSPDVFLDNDAAIFDDTALNFAPTLQSNITADSVTFNNNSNAYTIAANGSEVLTINQGITHNGTAASTISAEINSTSASGLALGGSGNLSITGGITGSNGLVKSGSGRATISSTVPSYTGNTFINEGVLEFQGTAISTATAFNHTIASGATLEYDTNGVGRNDPTSLDVSGAGTFRKTGGGQFSLISGGSDWDFQSGGLVSVDQGTFSFGGQNPGNWASNEGDMHIASGATFQGRATAITIDALTGSGTFGVGGSTRGSQAGTDGIGLTLGVDGGSGTFDGVIQNTTNWGGTGNTFGFGLQGPGEFAVLKTGAGTQTFTGANTYTGNTTINGGTLLINNTTGSGTGTGEVAVDSGGALGGTGSIAGDTTVASGANLGASDSIDSLTFAGGLDVQSGATLTWDLIGNSLADGQFDSYDITGGTFDIGTGVTFNIVTNGTGSLVEYADGFWDIDRSWLVLDFNMATAGTVNLFSLGTISADSMGNAFSGVTDGTFSFSNESSGIFLNFTAVPEPSTYALMGLGLGAFGWFAHRRRKQVASANQED